VRGSFHEFAKSLLPSAKFQVFEKLLKRGPAPTVKFLTKIKGEWMRVFESDAFQVHFDFGNNKELENDAQEARGTLKDRAFFQKEFLAALSQAPASILVVDVPAEQKGSKPEPYFTRVPISQVIDISTEDGPEGPQITHVVYKTEGEQYAAVCEQYYRVLEKDKGGKWKIITEIQHTGIRKETGEDIEGPGCPALFLWGEAFGTRNPYLKSAPLMAVLSDLDWLLFWTIAKKMLDLYGPFPIHVKMQEGCSYTDPHGNMCDSGYVSHTDDDGQSYRSRCPKCEESKHVGPGTMIEKPMPGGVHGETEIAKAYEIIAPDAISLEYCVAEKARLSAEILDYVVGYGGEPANNQAQNEKQVQGSFESRESALKSIRDQLQRAHQKALKIWAKLRYGNVVDNVYVHYGERFYLRSSSEILERYEKAKAAGLPFHELAQIRKDLLATKYRDQPQLLIRAQLLSQLEPYPDLNLEALMALAEKGFISRERLSYKLNFHPIIEWYEREYIPVEELWIIEGEQTINKIQPILIEYAKTLIEAGPTSPASGTTGEPAADAGERGTGNA
jgi:hypothetical protein